jgi:hypothetical protein
LACFGKVADNSGGLRGPRGKGPCRLNAARRSFGRLERGRERHPSDQLRSKFDLEAWIRLDVVNDLVIASYKIGDGDAASVGTEFPQLIKVERNELLYLEHVDAVSEAGVVRKAVGDVQAALPGYENRPKAAVQIFSATLNNCFAWRRSDVNSDVAEEKVSAPSGLLIRR